MFDIVCGYAGARRIANLSHCDCVVFPELLFGSGNPAPAGGRCRGMPCLSEREGAVVAAVLYGAVEGRARCSAVRRATLRFAAITNGCVQGSAVFFELAPVCAGCGVGK